MRQNDIFSQRAKSLLLAGLLTLQTGMLLAQGIQVHTKDGKTVDYPASTLSHVAPSIQAEPKQYGIDVFKKDGSHDNYLQGNLVSITSYTASTDDETGERQTSVVPTTGGTISMGDLKADFPAGTFNSPTQSTLCLVKKGYIDGEAELSKFYKMKLSGGVRKSFQVSVKTAKLTNDETVRMQFAVRGWAPSYGQESMIYHYMDVSYVDGAYVAEIPVMESPDDVSGVEIWFGLTRCAPVESASSAPKRRAGESDFKLYNKIKETAEVTIMLNNLNRWIPQAISKLEELGYQKPEGSVIDCYLHKDGGVWEYIVGSPYGWCAFSMWGKKYATINLNFSLLSAKSPDEIRATIQHELFHYFQQFYDPRSAPTLKYACKSTPLILEEASSVWSEHFYTKTPSVASENVSIFLPSLNPDHQDITGSKNAGLAWRERFANVGYGASTLLEYLTQKAGNQIVKDMWDERQTGDPFDTRDRIERMAKKYGIDIYTQETYHDFVEKLGTKQIYPDMTFEELVNLRDGQDSIGITTRMIENTKPVYFTNYLYEYGALAEKLQVSGNYDNDNAHGLDNATGTIEQTTDGVTTWVYRLEKQNYVPCGAIRKGKPLKIEPTWFYKRKMSDGTQAYTNSSYQICCVTIPDDFKTTAKPISRIRAQVITLDVPEKKLTVPSDPGSIHPKMISNYSLKLKPTVDWLTCFQAYSDSTLFIRHEAMPSNITSRTGTIQIILPNDDGTDTILEEVEVTQVQAYIGFDKTEYDVTAKGGTQTISITSTNCTNLEVSTESSFLHPTLSGTTVTVKIDENLSSEDREGIVVVQGVLPSVNMKVERYLHFKQTGIETQHEAGLFSGGYIMAGDLMGSEGTLFIPGQTVRENGYLHYRSADATVETTSSSRTEFSWTVELYIDPKDDRTMKNYEIVSGSVTWLKNYNSWYSDKDGNRIEDNVETRCSYNLKNLTTDYNYELRFHPSMNDEDNKKLADFITDYSYQLTRNGKTETSHTQTDIADERASSYSITVALEMTEGMPYLEANRDTLSFDGNEGFEIVSFKNNDAVEEIGITTSENWITISNQYSGGSGGNFYVNVNINKSKADRSGYIYLRTKAANDSTLIRTIFVTQKYESIWDDDNEEIEEQKAELPGQAVQDALMNAGMPLYLGSNPPVLDGVYKMEPLKTVYEYYKNGNSTGDANIIGTNLVLRLNTMSGAIGKANVSYYIQYGDQKTPAYDMYCYLGGSGNSFTLSNVTVTKVYDFTLTTIHVVSGELGEDNQLKNLRFALISLDEDGSIAEISIGADSNEVCEPTTWDPGTDNEVFSPENKKY